MDAESCLAALRMGGQCAKTLVVLKTAPKSSRSRAKISLRVGSPPSSSISRTLGIVVTSCAQRGPRGLGPCHSFGIPLRLATPRHPLGALEHEGGHVVGHTAGGFREETSREGLGLRLRALTSRAIEGLQHAIEAGALAVRSGGLDDTIR